MDFTRVLRAGAMATAMAFWGSSVSAEPIAAALASAYTNNPDILSAVLAAQASAENIVTAKAGLMPNISASAGLTDSFSVTGQTNSLSSSVSLNYSQNIFDNGVTDARAEAARAGAEAQMHAVKNTEQNVLLSAAQAYINVVRDRSIVQLRRETVAFLEAQVQAADDRLGVGEGTQTEVSQAQSRLAQSLADQQSAASNLAVSEANYVRYVGHAPSSLVLEFPFESKLPTSVEQAQALADAGHPAIMASLAQVRAAKAQSEAAKSAYGPTVSVSGGVSANNNFTSGMGGVSGSIGISVRVPIYQGGSLGANIRQTNLGEIRSEVDSHSVRDLIRAQIAQAWSSLRTAAAFIAAVQAAEDATQQVLNAVNEEFQVGQKTQLDVLNARSDLTSVQISKVQAQATRVTAAFSLLAATGRLTAADLGLAVNQRNPDTYRQKVEDVWQELRAIPQ